MLAFQPAQNEDIPLLRELAEQIWRASYVEIISPEQIEYMLRWMYSEEVIRGELAAGVCWELVHWQAEPAGFFAVTFQSDGVAKLNKLYLLERLQGRGFGQQMLVHIFRLAEQHGAREIRLQVNKRNVRAKRAYDRAGFIVADSAVFKIGEGFVMDDYVMVRRLPGTEAGI